MCVIPSLTQDLTSQKERHTINNSSLNLRFLLCVSEIQRVASGAFALVLSYSQPSHPSGNLESNWFAAIELSVLHYLNEMDYLTLQGYFSNHTKKKVCLTPISLYPGFAHSLWLHQHDGLPGLPDTVQRRWNHLDFLLDNVGHQFVFHPVWLQANAHMYPFLLATIYATRESSTQLDKASSNNGFRSCLWKQRSKLAAITNTRAWVPHL